MRGEKTEKECIRESSVQNCACHGHWKRERERERERGMHIDGFLILFFPYSRAEEFSEFLIFTEILRKLLGF
jgi:hypothetical protein